MSKNAKRKLKEAQGEDASEPVKPEPAAPHPALSVEKRLRSMVTGLLGGPRGDPDEHHMLAAAHCVLLMDQNGTPFKTRETLQHLSGNNIYDVDFMELARQDAHV